MAFTFTSSDRKKLELDGVSCSSDIAPESATLSLLLDGVLYPCDWDPEPAEVGDGGWTRDGVTADFFAGPRVPTGDLAGAVVLDSGIHYARIVVSAGGTPVGRDLPPFVIL